MLSVNTIYLSIALIILILVFLVSYLWQKQHQKYLHRQQSIGINLILQLRTLFRVLQQHRGLSQGILKGATELVQDRDDVQAEIDKQISAFAFIAQQQQFDLSKHSRWESILEHWQRFSHTEQEISAENSLQQHNKLVLNTLNFIDDIASHYHLHKLVNNNNESIRHIWLELLFSVENLGQIRALGTGIAALNHATPEEAIRLNYLSHALQYSLQQYFSVENMQQADLLVNVINDQLLQTPPTITAHEFFTLATNTIDAIFLTFDKQLQQFNDEITQPQKLKMANNAEHY